MSLAFTNLLLTQNRLIYLWRIFFKYTGGLLFLFFSPPSSTTHQGKLISTNPTIVTWQVYMSNTQQILNYLGCEPSCNKPGWYKLKAKIKTKNSMVYHWSISFKGLKHRIHFLDIRKCHRFWNEKCNVSSWGHRRKGHLMTLALIYTELNGRGGLCKGVWMASFLPYSPS